jgi:hypothetical protein
VSTVTHWQIRDLAKVQKERPKYATNEESMQEQTKFA